jgi:FdhD protein
VLRISLPADGRPGSRNGRADLLAAEEPLGIRIGGQALTLTMRTPGDDLDLAAGFLVSEGIVGRAGDVEQIRICPGDCGHPDHEGNVADVTLRPGRPGPAGRARSFLMTSACGVCGRSGIDDLIAAFRYDLTADRMTVT